MTTRLINPARTASNTARLASLPRLERASRTLARVGRELLCTLERAAAGDGLDVTTVWAAVETIATREQISGALAVVDELVPDDDNGADAAMRVALGERYRTVRPFLALLAGSPSLAASAGGTRLLAAVKALPDMAARKVTLKPMLADEIDEIDDALVPGMWKRAVYANPQLPAGSVDRNAYVLCVLEQLHKALRVRDVFAVPSYRWVTPAPSYSPATPGTRSAPRSWPVWA